MAISRRKNAAFCVPSPPGDSSSMSRRDGPDTYSMMTNGRPLSLCLTSKMVTRCGFLRFMHCLMPLSSICS